MSREEIDQYLDSKPGWIALTTLGADGYPHTVPLGYFRLDNDILMGVHDATVKTRNIDRDPRVSLMVESGTTMADIKGVMVQGRAEIVRAAEEVLHYMREGARQRGRSEEELPTSARPGAAFIKVHPDKFITWDYGQSD